MTKQNKNIKEPEWSNDVNNMYKIRKLDADEVIASALSAINQNLINIGKILYKALNK